jgi:hypothetical protein
MVRWLSSGREQRRSSDTPSRRNDCCSCVSGVWNTQASGHDRLQESGQVFRRAQNDLGHCCRGIGRATLLVFEERKPGRKGSQMPQLPVPGDDDDDDRQHRCK